MGYVTLVLKGVVYAFKAGAAFFGWRKQAEERANTPEMKANANAQRDAANADAANQEVAQAADSGDLTQIEKDMAE